MIAPPTAAAISMPDALPVMGPRFSMPRANSPGNMIELKNPTKIMLHIARRPDEQMDVDTRRKAMHAEIASAVLVVTFLSTAEPTNLPIMAPPQYRVT